MQLIDLLLKLGQLRVEGVDFTVECHDMGLHRRRRLLPIRLGEGGVADEMVERHRTDHEVAPMR